MKTVLLSRRGALALAAGMLAPLDALAREEAPIPVLPLALAVAEHEQRPVVEHAWLDEQVSEAQRLLAPHGLSVASARSRRLPPEQAALETAEDRDALAVHLDGKVIHVFVVASLRDVDDAVHLRMGVRWRLRRDLRKDYIIVAASARSSTLAHELGHFLGNGHSQVVDNVMSYERRDPSALAFDERQGAKMRRVARTLLRTGRILSLDAYRAISC